eukprot:2654308-Alexandrium_andersonii.AAC.1
MSALSAKPSFARAGPRVTVSWRTVSRRRSGNVSRMARSSARISTSARSRASFVSQATRCAW